MSLKKFHAPRLCQTHRFFLNWLKMHVFSYYWRLRNDALVHVQINVLVGPFVLNTREGVTTAFSTWSRMERATKIIKWTTRLKHREKPNFGGGFDSLTDWAAVKKQKLNDFWGQIGLIEPKLGFKSLASQKFWKKLAKTVKTVSFHYVAFIRFGCLWCFLCLFKNQNIRKPF